MVVFFNNHQHSLVPQVIEVLQQLEDDPQRLALERDREPPPPYQSSGETTQPPTPGPPVIDEYAQRCKRRKAHYRSQPGIQFDSQTYREHKRIIYQLDRCRSGRKQTLPFDQSMDLQANAENNVRSRWIEQGIWLDAWGPAWPEGSEPMTTRWRFSRHRPDRFPEPGGRWGHEKKPEEQPDSAPEPQEDQQSKYHGSVFLSGASKPEQSKAAVEDSASPPQPRDSAEASPRDPEASRPYYQFLAQISHEREWIKDELEYKRTRTFDIDAMAYESVKKNWIEDGVWDSEWGDLPGMTWRHEYPMENEADERPYPFVSGFASIKDTQLAPAPGFSGYPRLFGPGALEGAESGRREARARGPFCAPALEPVHPGQDNGGAKALNHPPADANEAQYPEQITNRRLQDVGSPDEQRNIEQAPSAADSCVQDRSQRFVESAQASNSVRNGKKRILNHDEDNEFCEERNSKPPPSKRPRRGRRGQTLINRAASEANANSAGGPQDTNPVARKSIRTTRKTGSAGNEASQNRAGKDVIVNTASRRDGPTEMVVDSPAPPALGKPPLRRSARIAAREKQSRAAIDKPEPPRQKVTKVIQAPTAPLQGRQLRPRTTKVAEGNHPNRRAGRGTSKPKGRMNTNRRRRQ
ncbi:predicted protein [Uncinocarpus reesii 1704]|uniref:Uncharacterized protein n=1 Tax=Uncinocarpus reesii (strain UAMH 1704) TaxID=336963 RepID=C4JQQ7_UNCRE|nr:uncharacterized protein UREG_04724 [Uncinocarpus reesii 1704]EEP79878.1 predicted protein [Uncinocarpus reesii 1704]